MPSCSISKSAEYYQDLFLRRKNYRNKLIAKGVLNGSNKMRTLMYRKGL